MISFVPGVARHALVAVRTLPKVRLRLSRERMKKMHGIFPQEAVQGKFRKIFQSKMYYAVPMSRALTGPSELACRARRTVFALMIGAALTVPGFSQSDTATITVGNLNLKDFAKVVLQGPSAPFAFSVPTYQDQTFYVVYRPPLDPAPDQIHHGLPGGGIPAQQLRIKNQGGIVTTANIAHVNLRFTISNWNGIFSTGSVIVTAGTKTKTAPYGATELILLDVDHAPLNFSITVNDAETVNGKKSPVSAPGLLPIKVDCPIVGSVRPHYYLLSVLYAPPGTDGGKSSSMVDYSSGSSAGTTTSASSVFSDTTDVKAEAGGGFLGGAKATAEFSMGISSTDSTSLDVRKTQTADFKIPGPAKDGIDHDYDQFLLWLNPSIDIQIDRDNAQHWQLNTPNGDPMKIQTVYAAYLKNPTLMETNDPGLKADLDAALVTADEYASILTADPFVCTQANPSACTPVPIDLNRFLPVSGGTFSYNPPLTPQDTVSTKTYSQSNSATSSNGKIRESDIKAGVTLQVSVGAPELFNVKITASRSFSWKNTSSYSQSAGTTQSAAFTIGGPAFGYKGLVDITVYWDSIYNSYMFAFSSDPTQQ
jgi:hypothetical protein